VSRRSFEQTQTELLFQLLDRLAHRWLGHMETFGGAAKMELVCHCDEDPKVAKIHLFFRLIAMKLKFFLIYQKA
jgi:hypothetical protein